MGLESASNKDTEFYLGDEFPLVSVVICVYNAGEYLRPSLLSVLHQTYHKIEILIIDDGSTDGCLNSVRDLLADGRVRFYHQSNATKPVALNRALDQIRGQFYAIHDADDISYPTRIEMQVRALLDRPSLAAVFCGHELIIGGRSVAPVFAPKSEAECALAITAMRMPALDPTGMYRVSLVRHLRYEASLPQAEGLDYILQVGEQYPMMVLGDCLYGYRIVQNSLTRRDPLQRERLVAEALRRACYRRCVDYARVFPEGPHGACRSRARLRDNNIAAHFITSVLDQSRARRHLAALRTGFQCVCLQPLDLHYYKALIYALISPEFVDMVRSRLNRITWHRRS
jgi:glycosyltransferase involved in cell wall biosynthesis